MSRGSRFPKDLAEAVKARLRQVYPVSPPVECLIALAETLYFASLRTEEGLAIRVYVAYIDPDRPDPYDQRVTARDRWTAFRLAHRLPLTVENVVKIARASDPRTSLLAVYHDTDQRLFCWGLIDQANRSHDFVNYDSEEEADRPGLFQMGIAGIGHLIAYMDYEKVADLKTDTLLRDTIDALRSGPVHAALLPAIDAYRMAVRDAVPQQMYTARPDWDEELENVWIATLCRILLRAQAYRHGGAILITPRVTAQGLSTKYRMHYTRLRTALENYAEQRIRQTWARETINAEHITQGASSVPVDLYVAERLAGAELEETRSEIDGAIWFVTHLTRVDGLVLMHQTLDVRGFGVVIRSVQDPAEVYLAGDANATKRRMRKVEPLHYGTRHRSMMQYCARVPGSVGFVISADGEVRAITHVGDRLMMWENLRLQYEYTPKIGRVLPAEPVPFPASAGEG